MNALYERPNYRTATCGFLLSVFDCILNERTEVSNVWDLSVAMVSLFSGHCELQPEGVLIRFGMVRSRIPYTKIERIVPSHNLNSSPAFSLDRSQIHTKNLHCYINNF